LWEEFSSPSCGIFLYTNFHGDLRKCLPSKPSFPAQLARPLVPGKNPSLAKHKGSPTSKGFVDPRPIGYAFFLPGIPPFSFLVPSIIPRCCRYDPVGGDPPVVNLCDDVGIDTLIRPAREIVLFGMRLAGRSLLCFSFLPFSLGSLFFESSVKALRSLLLLQEFSRPSVAIILLKEKKSQNLQSSFFWMPEPRCLLFFLLVWNVCGYLNPS